MSVPHEAKPRTTAVVLAGGTGQRVGLSIPKQLLKIAGKAVIEHTLTIFQNAEDIDDVIVLMAPGFVPDVEKIVAKAGLTKVIKVIEGGSTRNETTERAIAALGEGLAEGEDRNVLFHDAVRPLLSQRVIKDCVDALGRYQAVDVAIPSADTIIVTRTHGEDGEFITDVPDRSRLRRGQTRRRSSCPRSAGRTRSRPATRTSRPPTTARSSCATSPTCRSTWSRATSTT